MNDELGVVERALPEAIDILKPGGRLAVITFHSLEDRIVKQGFKKLVEDNEAELINKNLKGEITPFTGINTFNLPKD